MPKKPFDKISVNEMAQQADVNRSTWFRNFTSKSEALTFKLVQSWNRWEDEWAIAVRNRFTLDNARDFFQFNYEIRHILQVIYTADMQSAVYNAFYHGTSVRCECERVLSGTVLFPCSFQGAGRMSQPGFQGNSR